VYTSETVGANRLHPKPSLSNGRVVRQQPREIRYLIRDDLRSASIFTRLTETNITKT